MTIVERKKKAEYYTKYKEYQVVKVNKISRQAEERTTDTVARLVRPLNAGKKSKPKNKSCFAKAKAIVMATPCTWRCRKRKRAEGGRERKNNAASVQ